MDERFCGHTATEIADLLEALAKSADRCDANSQQEIASICRRGHKALRHLIAARAALTRPVTEAEVRTWHQALTGERDSSAVLDILAALRHFARAPGKTMIEGMTEDQIRDALNGGWEKVPGMQYPHEYIYYLATTPAPTEDPDRRAKELCWIHYQAIGNVLCNNAEEVWKGLTELGRNGWRAVAKSNGATNA